MQYSPMSSADRNTPSESSRNMASSPLNSVHDNDSNMQLLESNLKEVNSRIEKQNKIMSIQYKLIMASNNDSEDVEKLKKDLELLQTN
mmetsp:Transcript_26448/g.34401  ORF Transcript_26448/g.34401 Transcript_26448/m.34401 type:complete len:88 (+) Transcript_26448:547-810(+)